MIGQPRQPAAVWPAAGGPQARANSDRATERWPQRRLHSKQAFRGGHRGRSSDVDRVGDAGAAWDLPGDWVVHSVRGREAVTVSGAQPFAPVAHDWQRCGVQTSWRVPAADAQRWVGVVQAVFDAGSRGLPEECSTESRFLNTMASWMRDQSTLRGGQLGAYESVWRATYVALGCPDHWREVLDWVVGFKGVFCEPWCAAKRAEPHHARKRNGVLAAMRQEGLAPSVALRMLQQQRPPAMAFSNRFASAAEEDVIT